MLNETFYVIFKHRGPFYILTVCFNFFPGRAYPFRVSVLTDENEVNIILKYLHDFHLQNHPFCFSNVVPPMKTCARMKLPLPLILVALLALLSIMSKPPVNLSSNL